MIKTMLIAAVAALTVSTGANAGGVSTNPPADAGAENATNDWSGRYVGVTAANNSFDAETGELSVDGTPFPAPGFTFPNEGMSYGLEAGQIFQSKHLVYGFEVDASTASIDGKFGSEEETLIISTHSNWMASARGRLGFATGNVLFYVTGGLAVANWDAQLTDYYTHNSELIVFTPSVSETRTGWVDGIGAEFKVNQNWSVKAEYLRYDFGTETENFVEGDDRTFTSHGSYAGNQTRIGLNYRF